MADRRSDQASPKQVIVVGGGPAGLRAAEVAAAGGAQVTVFEGKGSVGRKFLIAGRNGLNLTQDEPMDEFLGKYVIGDGARDGWQQIIRDFDPAALRAWALGLGVETFVSKGKVLPVPVDGRMGTTPLLRNWIARLVGLGVRFELNHRWTGFGEHGQLLFEHKGEARQVEFDRVILALGGGSWPRSGSDGSWVRLLAERGIECVDLAASNCGWQTAWPAQVLEMAEGLPIKNLALSAGGKRVRGELVLTRYGLEGPPIYRLGPILRAMDQAEVQIDFKPDMTKAQLMTRMGSPRRNFVREAKRRLKLDVASAVLLGHMPGRGPWRSVEQIVDEIKCFRLRLDGPRPMDEAISTAGGVAWAELDEDLQLKKLPGVFVAGEMVDWDAPTGGYLLQGCFSSGTWAAKAALNP